MKTKILNCFYLFSTLLLFAYSNVNAQTAIVNNVNELRSALNAGNTTITLNDGLYNLGTDTIYISNRNIFLTAANKWKAEIISTSTSDAAIYVKNGSLQCNNIKFTTDYISINLNGVNSANINGCYFATTACDYAINSTSAVGNIIMKYNVFNVANGAVSIDLTTESSKLELINNTILYGYDAIALDGSYYYLSHNIFYGSANPFMSAFDDYSGTIEYNLLSSVDISWSNNGFNIINNVVDADPGFSTFPELSFTSYCKDNGRDNTYIGAIPYVASCSVNITPKFLSLNSYEFSVSPSGFLLATSSIKWYIDGTPIAETTPIITKVFNQAKNYIIRVEVTSSECVDPVTYETSVDIAEVPGCSVIIQPRGLTPNSFEFEIVPTGFSALSGVTWFINGSELPDKTPKITHIFDLPGTYTIKANATSGECAQTVTNETTVEISEIPCTAAGTITVDSIKHTLNTIYYTLDVTNADSVTIIYGDTIDNFIGFTGKKQIKHTYSESGQKVFIAHFYKDGCFNSVDNEVVIGCKGKIFAIPNTIDTTGRTHEMFTYYSDTDAKYLWDFGDGKTDTLQYVEHIYNADGNYIVKLTISNPKTCTATSTLPIEVGKNSCKAAFSYTIENNTVSFKNLSSVANYYWNFGDENESTSSKKDPVFTYSEPGYYSVFLQVYNEATYCYENISEDLIVGDVANMVYADWSYDAVNDNVIQFVNYSSNNVNSWYWSFGDGSFSVDSTPKHDFKKPGIYEVCLIAKNTVNGSNDEDCYEIWVGDIKCTAQAEFSYRVDTATNTVKCVNKSKGDIDFYYWDFGDGSTSNDSAPKAHQYGKPGYYYISLSVQKQDSWCSDFYSEYVQVGEMPCIAKFNYTVDVSKKTVNFANTSKGITAEYYWWFDDGTNSTDKDPVKVFDYNGLHYAGLTVISDNGECWDYTEKEIQVGEIECSAKFTYYVDKATNKAFCQNKAIGSNVGYYWMFGDGAESTDTNPVHKFDYPGYYTISLNTFDPNTWCMDYFEAVVLVGEEGIDCAADFIYTIDNAKQEVTFKDNSKGTIVDYIWDFGDGEWDDNSKTTHKYNKGGYYNVCLNVWNNMGIPNITCKQIKVAATAKTDCQAKFAFSVDTAKKTVTFFNKSLGKPTGFEWNFGDGSATKKVAKPDTAHKYTKADYYLASLVITTDSGCTSSAYKLVNVNMPDTGFVVRFGSESRPYDKKAGGYPIDFIGAGLGDQAKLKWEFGDDSTNTTSNTPTHVYDDASTPYTVCLTYADPVTGDSATHCEEVTTAKLCESDQMQPTAICKAYTLVLDAAGTGTLKISDVDNKSADDCGAVTLALSKTSFTSADLGAKKVTLTATDPSGNKATCEANITVTANDAINSAVMVSGLEVYPNPFNDKITVSYNLLDNSTVDITIYDMVGKKVTSLSSTKLMSGLQTTQYDVSGLQSGGYILQVRTSNGVVKKQMIMKK